VPLYRILQDYRSIEAAANNLGTNEQIWQYQSKPVKPKRRELHPVWRGLALSNGCHATDFLRRSAGIAQ
jgi:hypothetical protein